MTDFSLLLEQTEKQVALWKCARGIAPEAVVAKIENAPLDCLVELTECLSIWIEKGESMSTGELILARTNLGAVVECWLRFFYYIHYLDYKDSPLKKKGTTIIEPEDLSFEQLKKFSTNILWDDEQTDDYKWIESVQKKRNTIHAFKNHEIGTCSEFLKDVDALNEFVENLISHFPPLEVIMKDYMDDISCY